MKCFTTDTASKPSRKTICINKDVSQYVFCAKILCKQNDISRSSQQNYAKLFRRKKLIWTVLHPQCYIGGNRQNVSNNIYEIKCLSFMFFSNGCLHAVLIENLMKNCLSYVCDKKALKPVLHTFSRIIRRGNSRNVVTI